MLGLKKVLVLALVCAACIALARAETVIVDTPYGAIEGVKTATSIAFKVRFISFYRCDGELL